MSTTRALEEAEIHKLFGCVSGRYAFRNRTMLICGIAMALRATELCRLNVGDVLDDNGDIRLYVTIRGETAKFGKGRTIRIGVPVRAAIGKFIDHKCEIGESLDSDAPLFCSQKGGYLDRTRLFRIVTGILKRAGISESVHTLRKTGGTHYYVKSNYDLIATQQFLGHTDPSVTRKYINMTTEQLEQYSEDFSEFLFEAITGIKETRNDAHESWASSRKGNSKGNLLPFSDSDLLMELHIRGHDISEIVARMRRQELRESKIVSIEAVRRLS